MILSLSSTYLVCELIEDLGERLIYIWLTDLSLSVPVSKQWQSKSCWVFELNWCICCLKQTEWQTWLIPLFTPYPQMSKAVTLPCLGIVSMARRPKQTAKTKQIPPATSVGFGMSKRKEPLWQCVEGCGACCKLDKGPSFATPEEIFADPTDIEVGALSVFD